MGWYCLDRDHNLILKLYIQPGARQTEAIGVHGEELKIKLAAPPMDGKANRALAVFLAKRFNVPLKHITLKWGAQSRHKVVEIYQPVNGPEVLFNEIRAE
ncbi:DUF167 domain-containing protein [Nitrosomonas eutropha]|uniref:UPF0235 protein Neut_2146 n=2 Tax=Nitrosomonas eutropha TaxID=916 RepID=Y2146_NITEC|nr:DUF167 family protein [Nitrosomonas eutropha]Q0AE64.1 RecName: Full=UPF0235 protein Neut_2146 [Nitrosomonas eutropha C91]ABI60368.1 protein of unknown function DUF167 [Nitrosomonas eutropha C91]PXV83772.1 hypothetical protein C8R14_10368 [Nitrosomonas eutropha]SEI54876.1 hypothetical protein SAMN05216318_10568 [Nitrosomonas eutropha]